jgi:hypothetical protein
VVLSDSSDEEQNTGEVFANTDQSPQNASEFVDKTYELGVDEFPVPFPKGAADSHTAVGTEGICMCPSRGTQNVSSVIPVSTELPVKEGLEIVPWTGNYEWNRALQRYWMCGLGSLQPKHYHPGLATSTLLRQERLQREEREATVAARVKADELAASQEILSPPTSREAPDLYHLAIVRPNLLSWPWKTQASAEFLRDFELVWCDGSFQQAMRDCSMWWACEAKVRIQTLLGSRNTVPVFRQSSKYCMCAIDVEAYTLM